MKTRARAKVKNPEADNNYELKFKDSVTKISAVKDFVLESSPKQPASDLAAKAAAAVKAKSLLAEARRKQAAESRRAAAAAIAVAAAATRERERERLAWRTAGWW